VCDPGEFLGSARVRRVTQRGLPLRLGLGRWAVGWGCRAAWGVGLWGGAVGRPGAYRGRWAAGPGCGAGGSEYIGTVRPNKKGPKALSLSYPVISLK
jgi:hypothetical protein